MFSFQNCLWKASHLFKPEDSIEGDLPWGEACPGHAASGACRTGCLPPKWQSCQWGQGCALWPQRRDSPNTRRGRACWGLAVVMARAPMVWDFSVTGSRGLCSVWSLETRDTGDSSLQHGGLVLLSGSGDTEVPEHPRRLVIRPLFLYHPGS